MIVNFNSTVANLNNEAVSYLQEGNYCAAVWDLEMSMEQLRHLHFCDQQNLKPLSYDAGALRVTSVPIAPAPLHRGATNNNIFDFYRRAFRIVSSPAEQLCIHPLSSMIVVRFNMAIAYHDDAIRRNRKSHFYLALEMYEEILQMMKHYNIQGHMLLLLAIGNNMGHIHSHLLNFEQTREALYWVRQLAISSRRHFSAIPYDDYTFFYQTVIIFNGNDLTLAPAA